MNILAVSKRVEAALQAVGMPVRHAYSQGWLFAPVIVWRESDNHSLARADGGEMLSELEYTLDIYSTAQEESALMAQASDAALAEILLKRTYSAELFESDMQLYHRVMRYRCVVDRDGNIYQ